MEKYGIIEEVVTYVEGDERSRTNPGHGYGSYTDITTEIWIFDDREKWEDWIKRNVDKKFTPIVYREAKVTKEVKISIDVE